MSQAKKRYEAMERNPRGDYTIEDVVAVAQYWSVSCIKAKTGSHWNLKHSRIDGILTVPRRLPVKTVYIVLLLEMISTIRRLP